MVYIFLKLLIFLTIFHKKLCEQIIQGIFTRNSGILELLLRLGNPKQTAFIPIDITNHFTWVTSQIFIKNLSQTATVLQEDPLTVQSKVVSAQLLLDQIEVPNQNQIINGFLFFYVKNKDSLTTNGALGLSYKVTSKKISFVHRLEEASIISKLTFSIKSNNYLGGQIYFGGIPNDIIQYYPYTSSCKVNNTEKQWGCNLNYVYIGDNSKEKYSYNNISFFTSNNYNSFIPLDFLIYLNNTLFSNYYDLRACFNVNENDKKMVKCDCKKIKNFPNITFVIDNNHYSFTKDDLFIISGEECRFIFQHNRNLDNKWYFGDSLFMKYMIEFDYSQSEVRFYSEDQFSYQIKNPSDYFYLYLVIIIILIINICYLLFIKVKVFSN